MPLKALSPLLHELGFTSLQRSIFETLTNAALTMKALSLQQLLRFLAAHCSSGGAWPWGRWPVARLHGAAAHGGQGGLRRRAAGQGGDRAAGRGCRAGAEPREGPWAAVEALFFGQDAYEKWNLLWKRCGL